MVVLRAFNVIAQLLLYTELQRLSSLFLKKKHKNLQQDYYSPANALIL
jgi:hypothetical protein